MLVTLLGITTWGNPVLSKAPPSMVVIPVPISIEESLSHLAKAASPIFVTLFGKVTEVRSGDSKKAKESMAVT
jgi:hypothetical protein